MVRADRWGNPVPGQPSPGTVQNPDNVDTQIINRANQKEYRTEQQQFMLPIFQYCPDSGG